jgi:hypothetical protein
MEYFPFPLPPAPLQYHVGIADTACDTIDPLKINSSCTLNGLKHDTAWEASIAEVYKLMM